MNIKIAIIFTCFIITSCSNTVNGLGRDMQDGGMAIQDGISDIRQSLNI